MKSSRDLRDQVIATAHALHARGWVANHDGNITVRRGPGRFLATPTAVSKARVDHQNLIEVDGAGKRISGTARSFSEIGLHLTVYPGRDDVGAVVHAPPPCATALAASRAPLVERPFSPEVVVSLGPWIPTVPLAAPGAAAEQALAAYVGDVDAVLLGGHGVLAWGADLETAFLRLELVEHHARIAITAQATGGVRPLPASMLPALCAARAKAGLGRAAERAVELLGRLSPTAPPVPAPSGEIATLVREELDRALRR